MRKTLRSMKAKEESFSDFSLQISEKSIERRFATV